MNQLYSGMGPRSALLLWNIWGTSSALHFDVGVQLIDLFPEAVPEIGAFGFQGGRQEAVLDGEHLGVKSNVLHLRSDDDEKAVIIY